MAKEIIKIENRKEIDKVIFKAPELMASDAEDKIKALYREMVLKEEELHSFREKTRELEKDLNLLKDRFYELSKIFEYSFKEEEKEINIEKCTVALQGHGNDIIGRTTVL